MTELEHDTQQELTLTRASRLVRGTTEILLVVCKKCALNFKGQYFEKKIINNDCFQIIVSVACYHGYQSNLANMFSNP